MNRDQLLELFGNESISGKRITLHVLTPGNTDLLLNYTYGTLNTSEEFSVLMKNEFMKTLNDKYKVHFLIYSECGDFIGYTELKNLDETPEIGIDLAEKYQRNGYGFETCRLLINKLFEKTNYEYISYNTFRYNKASIALAKKLRASYIGCISTFDVLKTPKISNDAKAETEQFDILQYRIYK
mgnify:FL=1